MSSDDVTIDQETFKQVLSQFASEHSADFFGTPLEGTPNGTPSVIEKLWKRAARKSGTATVERKRTKAPAAPAPAPKLMIKSSSHFTEKEVQAVEQFMCLKATPAEIAAELPHLKLSGMRKIAMGCAYARKEVITEPVFQRLLRKFGKTKQVPSAVKRELNRLRAKK